MNRSALARVDVVVVLSRLRPDTKCDAKTLEALEMTLNAVEASLGIRSPSVWV